MESIKRHRDINHHPEIKSNQLEVASWHSSGGMSTTNPSNKSIHLTICPSTKQFLLSSTKLMCKAEEELCFLEGETEGELFWSKNKKEKGKRQM